MTPTIRWPAQEADVLPLKEPLVFSPSGKSANNRLMKTAMTEGLGTWDPEVLEARGIPTEAAIELYRRWGEGENTFGIIITGNIDIEYDQVDAIGDFIVTLNDRPEGLRFERFKAMAEAGKANGALMVGQVTHPGNQLMAHIRKDTISASDIQLGPFGEFYATPRAATKEDIDHVVAGFVHVAEYLAVAGFDGMQLHGAHGYLLAQFLSRSMNKRTDEYGGTLRKRLQIIIDIGRGIRNSPLIPKDFVFGIKLNSVEFQDGGMTADEAREIVATFETEVDFDFIELSGGTWANFDETMTWERESTRKRESFFLEFADHIVPALGSLPRKTKVFVTGGLRSAAAFVDALNTVDGVGFARPAAQEPRFANDILSGRIQSAIMPIKELQTVAMGVPMAATQLGQIARGEEPFNASDEKEGKAYIADFNKWYDAAFANLHKLDFQGYVELTLPQRPYGTEHTVAA
ncbi:putative NADH oxidase [Thozetella sp. PMI_491]|nr:putative NADH oxidase [Thozetella sp. PMI_491]